MKKINGVVLRFAFLLSALTTFARAESAGTPFSVLTQNVWGLPGILVKDKIPRLKQFCKTLKAHAGQESAWDVVALQELWMMRDQWNFQDCGYEYAASEDIHMLDSGLMVLSKYPILDQFKIRYSVKNDPGVIDAETFAHKGALFVLIRHPVIGKIWIVTTHLASSYKHHTNTRARIWQLEELSEWLKELDPHIPVVLAGDFNTGPGFAHDQAWDQFPSLFPGLKEASYPSTICTSCGDNPYTKGSPAGIIDHIFTSSLFKVISGEVALKETFTKPHKSKLMHYSDHYAWHTLLEFNP